MLTQNHTKRSMIIMVILAAIMLVLAVFVVPSFTGMDSVAALDQTEIVNQSAVTAQTSPYGTVYTNVYNEVSPSVVAISVNSARGAGAGSGFVFDRSGHIITNNHVVEGAEDIAVEFFDGTLARGKVVGVDPDSDLAVIQVDVPENRLFPVEFANSEQLIVGQEVLAIGSPFGQEWTLTRGIVSALNRTIQGLSNFSIGGVIQTDAPINPGNSGGPLLDVDGHVIGVNSQILSASRSSSGVGFAIPANLTQRVAKELIENGNVEYSFIGISGGNVNLSLIESLDLPDNLRGVVVSEVVPNGPAAQSGLHNAEISADGTFHSVDIITGIDGTPVRGMEDLVAYLARSTQPGQNVHLNVLRNGTEQLDLDVMLTARA
jgi:serine protease Do